METCHSGGAPPASDWQWDIAGSDKALSRQRLHFTGDKQQPSQPCAEYIAILDTRLLIPPTPTQGHSLAKGRALVQWSRVPRSVDSSGGHQGALQ